MTELPTEQTSEQTSALQRSNLKQNKPLLYKDRIIPTDIRTTGVHAFFVKGWSFFVWTRGIG